MRRKKNGSQTVVVLDINTIGAALTILCVCFYFFRNQLGWRSGGEIAMDKMAENVVIIKTTLISLDARVAALEGKPPRGLLTQELGDEKIEATTKGAGSPGG